VDDLIERLLLALDAAGQLGNTYVFFTSDNGYMSGNHRFPSGKDAPYEESIRVPLFVRGPGVPAGVTLPHDVSNVDLAPTLAELGQAQAPTFVDGRSLAPLLTATPTPLSSWRQDLLMEHEPADPNGLPSWFALRNSREKYVDYPANAEEEYYDLVNDPFETDSRHRQLDAARPGAVPLPHRTAAELRGRDLPSVTGALALAVALLAGEQDVDARVVKLLEQVSAERLQKTIEKLVSFETRNTLSNPEQAARGVGAARQWILDELKATSPRLQVSFDAYQVAGGQIQRIPKDVELRNVMALLPGKSPRRLYVSGHYDSVVLRRGQAGAAAAPAEPGGAPQTFDPATLENPAPGANDDGSGTALTMELARVFANSGIEFDATLVFLCLAGEEQGLVGAKLHAQKAAAENWPIQAVLNNDIVGGSKGGNGVSDSGSVRVFSEGPRTRPRARSPATSSARPRCTCRRTAWAWSPGTTASAVAATTRRSTSTASRPCASARRPRTTRASTARRTCRRASTSST
jgi:hypothetical protein